MNSLDTHWIKELVDDLKGEITEGVFTSRDILIECYHNVGERLRKASDEHKMPITDLVNECAGDINVSERKLWYAVKFYDKFPIRTLVPGGKNISWHKIKTQYLTEGKKEEKVCEHEPITICRKCKKQIENAESQ
jgi:hypothetical protein